MLYKGDTVRLVRELPDLKLEKHQEGTVTGIRHSEDGHVLEAEVRFYTGSGALTETLPFDAVELVIEQFHDCTAVLWRLEESPQQIVEQAMHAMLNHGFEMRQGPNVMRLDYSREDRFWRKGERSSDATGAHVVVAAPAWDGCIVAFSGRQRFHLEFRLQGRRPPCVLLHQRYEAYQEQRASTPPAMTILRVLLNLCNATRAECCALPVAGTWMMDESWDSLLQQPFFPDLFLVPRSKVPEPLPPLFRMQRLQSDRAILTTLPVKFAPGDDSIERTERELKLNQLRVCIALGEKAYDQMYESSGSVTGLYSDAKEAFRDAIVIANELGLTEESTALSKRLEHIKAVFRSQFS